jgi:hypothetical protein
MKSEGTLPILNALLATYPGRASTRVRIETPNRC